MRAIRLHLLSGKDFAAVSNPAAGFGKTDVFSYSLSIAEESGKNHQLLRNYSATVRDIPDAGKKVLTTGSVISTITYK